jgi:hypothetical protein
MATDSIMGLFQSPEQYQQQRQAIQQAQAMEMAKLSPFQQGQANIQMGMNRFADVGAGLLGIQDPQIQRQTQRRAFIQQVNMADPNSLKQAIQASANDPEMAAFLMGKYKELTGIQKDQSIITKNEKYEKAEADKTQVRSLLADVETRLNNNEPVSQVELNKAKLAYSEKGQPTPRFDPTTNTVLMLPGIDMSMFPNLTKAFGKTAGGSGGGAGGMGGQVSVMDTPMSEEARRGRLNSLEAGSAQLQVTLDAITQTKGLIGNKTTGYGAYLAGLPTSDAMTLADNTEQIKASVALTKLKEMKQESKTGASGLGALNIKELETIQSILGKLNPKSANYGNDLKKVEAFFVRAQKAMDEEVRLTRGKTQQQQSPAPNSPDVAPKPSAMSGKNPQLQSTLAANPEAWVKNNMDSNKGYSRAEVIKRGIEANRLPANYQ